MNMKKLDIEVPPIIGLDKIAHFLMFYVFAFVMLYDSNKSTTNLLSPTLSFLIAVSYGFIIELLQSLTGYRSYDLYDALTDAIGALFGILLYRFNENLYEKLQGIIVNKARSTDRDR